MANARPAFTWLVGSRDPADSTRRGSQRASIGRRNADAMPPDLPDQLSNWWSAQLNWQHQPGLWVLGSLAVAVIAWWTLWLALHHIRFMAASLSRFLSHPVGLMASWLLRLTWLVGPGYAALLQAAVLPRPMGLTQIDWGAAFGYGLAFVLLGWLILLMVGLSYRRAAPAVSPWPSAAAALSDGLLLVLEAGALQWHWSFYRGAAIMASQALGLAQPWTAGTWLGTALILLEGVSNPFLWRDLRRPGRAESRILRAALLIASSILFLISRNFWLGWAFHGLPAALLEPRFVQTAQATTRAAGNHQPPAAHRT